jgi:exopolyphosphatase/guanosine-5'-triphosphate,3'-diphosphate pyrophosphatase
MTIVANIARYHRRALPQKSHISYMLLDRRQRVEMSKLAAMLRLANALDADHLQKIRSVRVVHDSDPWTLQVESTGDVTIERLASMARADLFTEVFGRRLTFQEVEAPA